MRTSRQGTFIVIEGTDGSGKGTQFALLRDHLLSAGYDIETFDFPQYDQPSSYFVKQYLNGAYGTADQVGPYTSSLFYALDRFEAAPRIQAALDAGKVVIANRFTGSSMGHQGTKFQNPEERRGFFIWLDNLEFEMLHIPRPDMSFVLRVPADIAQSLVDQKGERSYTDKKRDIHEADLSHLERAVSVYDDLTQLFPKDFQRIDCVRSGRLLDIETVQAMLREKINPFLPVPGTIKGKITAEPTTVPAKAANTDGPQTLTLEHASSLLVQKVERFLGPVELTYPEAPAVYQPVNLLEEAGTAYREGMDKLFALHAKLLSELAGQGIPTADAQAAAQAALPVSLIATIRVSSSAAALPELLTALLNDLLPEAQAAGASLAAQMVKHGVLTTSPTNESPLKLTAPAAVNALAVDLVNENPIGDQSPAQLTGVWPRNEVDLVADMLYEHTALPLRTLQDRINAWPIDRKLAVLEAYLSDKQPGAVLQKAHYSWDVISSWHSFCALQRYPVEDLERQLLTPRQGYDIPKIIDDAGLSELFEACFDLSLSLYSTLQQAGHYREAQYAVLQGHKLRWKLTANASQIRELQTLPTTNAATADLLRQLEITLSEAHPTLGEAIAKTK